MKTFAKKWIAALGVIGMIAQAVPASANNGDDWRRDRRMNTHRERVQADRPRAQIVTPQPRPQAYTGQNWSDRTWNGRTWNGRTWNGNTWTGGTWSGQRWNDQRWRERNFNNPAWAADRWNWGGRHYWHHYRERNEDIAAGLLILGLAGLFLANGSPYYGQPAWNAPCFNDIYGFRGYYHDGGCYAYPAPY